MTDNRTKLARDWYSSKEELDRAKKLEGELRKATIEAYFGEEKVAGSRKESLSSKANLVYSASKRITIVADKFKEFEAQLRAKGLIGDGKLITMKPTVSLTAYKHLSDEAKAQFDELFEHSVSAPQLSVKLEKE